MGRRSYTVKSCGVSNVPMERLVQLQPPLNGHGDDDDGDAATLVVVVDVPEADLLSHYYHYRLQREGVSG